MVSVRQGHFRPHHQTVPILDHDVAQVRQLCTLVVPLGEHPRIRIRGALVGVVLPALAAKIHAPVPPAAAATAVVVRSVLLLEPLLALPPSPHPPPPASPPFRSP